MGAIRKFECVVMHPRNVRIAIQTGRECCPTTVVFTEPCTNRPILNYMRPD
jgi:hypothetical protein